MGNSRNSFKYFLNFSTLRSNFSKKCKEAVFEICGVMDQVDHGESAKTNFLGFSRANISIAMGLQGRYLGPYLTFGGKYSEKISRS